MKRLITWMYMRYVYLPEFRSFRHVKDRANFIAKYPFDILPASEYDLVLELRNHYLELRNHYDDSRPNLSVVKD